MGRGVVNLDGRTRFWYCPIKDRGEAPSAVVGFKGSIARHQAIVNHPLDVAPVSLVFNHSIPHAWLRLAFLYLRKILSINCSGIAALFSISLARSRLFSLMAFCGSASPTASQAALP